MKTTNYTKFLAGAKSFTKFFATIAATAVVAVSCIEGSEVAFFETFEEEGAIEIGITAEASDIGAGNAAARAMMATRVKDDADTEDKKIYDLWVIQFDGGASAGDGTATARAARYISNYTDEDKRIVRLYPGTDQEILYVANTNTSNLFSRTMTYEEIMGKIDIITSENDVFANVNTTLIQDDDKDKKRFVMSAYKTGVAIVEDDTNANKTALTATLQRNVAKIEFTYGYYPVSSTSNVSVTINSYVIRNVASVSSYVAYNITTAGATYPEASVGFINYGTVSFVGTVGSFTDVNNKTTDGCTLHTVVHYVPVNMRASATGSTTWAEKYTYATDNSLTTSATAIVVSGVFDDGANDNTDGYKYDFTFTEYLGSTAADFELKPNNYYAFDMVVSGSLSLENIEVMNAKGETRFTHTKQ